MASADVSTPELEALFKKANAAGDVKTAGTLANEIKRRRASSSGEPSWGETLGRAAINAPASAYKNLVQAPIDFVKTAVTDPEQAARAVFSPIAGAVRQIPGLEGDDTNPMVAQSKADFKALKDEYVRRYGSLKGFKETLGSDPFAIATDVASVVGPVKGAVGLGGRAPLLSAAARVATNPLGEATGAVIRHAAQVPKLFNGPRGKAANVVADAAERYPNAAADLQQLGPHALLGDVLGNEGQRIGKTASNINPQAGDLIKSTLRQRNEGRAARLLSAEEDTRAAHRPLISDAYRTAKAEGYDLPKVQETVPDPRTAIHGAGTFSPITRDTNIPRGFEDIINEPLLRPFWNRAEKLVGQLENVEDQGDFARLDKFRSELNKASNRATDPTQALALKQGADDIEAAMERANISPGREGARQSHINMLTEVELQTEIARRIEDRFRDTRSGMTGNSTTTQQAGDVLTKTLNRSGIIGDLMGGRWVSATGKIVSLLMGEGINKANAAKMAAQVMEEATLLMGREFPARPATHRISEAGRLLGTGASQGVLLGSKSQQLLGGPR